MASTSINLCITDFISNGFIGEIRTIEENESLKVVIDFSKPEQVENAISVFEKYGAKALSTGRSVLLNFVTSALPFYLDLRLTNLKWLSHDAWIEQMIDNRNGQQFEPGSIISWLQNVLPGIHPYKYLLAQPQVDDIAEALLKHHGRCPTELEYIMSVLMQVFNIGMQPDVSIQNVEFESMATCV